MKSVYEYLASANNVRPTQNRLVIQRSAVGKETSLPSSRCLTGNPGSWYRIVVLLDLAGGVVVEVAEIDRAEGASLRIRHLPVEDADARG